MIYSFGNSMRKRSLKDSNRNLPAKPLEYVSQGKEIDPFEADLRKDSVRLIIAEIFACTRKRKRRSDESLERKPYAA